MFTCVYVCSETEIKQLNGWKATVENLRERFDDITKQIELLSDIELGQQACHSSRAAASGEQLSAADAAAVAAEEGAAGPLAAGAISRSGLVTAQHTVQRNKLRWVEPHVATACGSCDGQRIDSCSHLSMTSAVTKPHHRQTTELFVRR